jgi:hypothetical protein
MPQPWGPTSSTMHSSINVMISCRTGQLATDLYFRHSAIGGRRKTL